MSHPAIIAAKIHQATAQLATERKPARRLALLDVMATFERQLWQACADHADSDEEQFIAFEYYLSQTNPIHQAA